MDYRVSNWLIFFPEIKRSELLYMIVATIY